MHFRKVFNTLTKTTLKPYSWPFSSRRRLGDKVKSFPLFAVFDVALLSVFLEELVNGCHKKRANVCLRAVYICL